MSRVLVTGASGFIGRQCVPMLVAKGHEVHALARRVPAPAASPNVSLRDETSLGEVSSHGNVSWHHTDLLQPGTGTRIISEVKPECVLHLAWCATPGKFWEARENIEWVRASLELLMAFADNGGKRIVAAGTCAEYSDDAGECHENATPLQPSTLYGISKRAFGTILCGSSRQTGLSSAWGRNFFLYGPREDESRLVAYTVQTLLRGEPALCSEGLQTLDFMHVEDAASAYAALLESGVEGPVNIGSGNPVPVREVLRQIGQQLGRLDLIRFGARESNSQPTRLWANTRRLKEEVGWKARYDLRNGIAQTIEWRRTAMTSTAPTRRKRETIRTIP